MKKKIVYTYKQRAGEEKKIKQKFIRIFCVRSKNRIHCHFVCQRIAKTKIINKKKKSSNNKNKREWLRSSDFSQTPSSHCFDGSIFVSERIFTFILSIFIFFFQSSSFFYFFCRSVHIESTIIIFFFFFSKQIDLWLFTIEFSRDAALFFSLLPKHNAGQLTRPHD